MITIGPVQAPPVQIARTTEMLDPICGGLGRVSKKRGMLRRLPLPTLVPLLLASTYPLSSHLFLGLCRRGSVGCTLPLCSIWRSHQRTAPRVKPNSSANCVVDMGP